MTQRSSDVGNDFKPERDAEVRRRRLKALRWLALMTAVNAAGLLGRPSRAGGGP